MIRICIVLVYVGFVLLTSFSFSNHMKIYRVKLHTVALIVLALFALGCSKNEGNSICGMWRCQDQVSLYLFSGYLGTTDTDKVFKNIVIFRDGTGFRVGNDDSVSCEFTWKQSRDTVFFSYPNDCNISDSKLVINVHATDKLEGVFYDYMRNDEYPGEILRISPTVLKR